MTEQSEILERRDVLLGAFLGSTALWFSFLGITQVVIPMDSPFDFANVLRMNPRIAIIAPITSLILGILLEPTVGRRLYTEFLGRLPDVRRKILFGSYFLLALFIICAQFVELPTVFKVLTMISIGCILTSSMLIYVPMVSSSMKRWEATGLLLTALCVGILIIIGISLVGPIKFRSIDLVVIFATVMASCINRSMCSVPQHPTIYEKSSTTDYQLFEVFLWLGIQVFLLGLLDARTETLQLQVTNIFAFGLTNRATALLLYKVLIIIALGLAFPYILNMFDRRYIFPSLYLITGVFFLAYEYEQAHFHGFIFLLLSSTIWVLTVELALYTQSYLGSENSALSGIIIMIFWGGPPIGAYISTALDTSADLLTQILLMVSVVPLTSLLVTLPKETDAKRAVKYLFAADKLKNKK